MSLLRVAVLTDFQSTVDLSRDVGAHWVVSQVSIHSLPRGIKMCLGGRGHFNFQFSDKVFSSPLPVSGVGMNYEPIWHKKVGFPRYENVSCLMPSRGTAVTVDGQVAAGKLGPQWHCPPAGVNLKWMLSQDLLP